MITREQEHTVESLANAHGKVSVRHGFTDGCIHVFTPRGQVIRVNEDGDHIDCGISHSTKWEASYTNA